MNDREKLLHAVRKHHFALVEANLFLDTHPEDQAALMYFRRQKELYKKAVAVYEEKYGPLSVDSSADDSAWQWNTGPWPWENGG